LSRNQSRIRGLKETKTEGKGGVYLGGGECSLRGIESDLVRRAACLTWGEEMLLRGDGNVLHDTFFVFKEAGAMSQTGHRKKGNVSERN